MTPSLDIAILGGGAAGLTAGIFAGHAGQGRALRLAVLDGAPRVGAKILVAGGGRCNVTHDLVTPEDYNGGNRHQIAKVLRSFDVPATVQFFADLGVTLKREETGKLFPTTNRAQTVLDALLRALRAAGVELRPGQRVTAVQPAAEGFALTTSTGAITTRRLILATGGRSLPKTGSDGAGYDFARALGHTVTPTTPALVPLLLPPGHYLTRLSGISLDVVLTLAAGTDKVLHRQAGALLFTHFGLSGPAVMDLSRHWIAARQGDDRVKLTAQLLPDADYAAIEQRVLAAAAKQPRGTLAGLVGSWFPERLARALLEQEVPLDPQTPLARLSKVGRRALVQTLVALPLPVVRDRGYLFAEVTAGGVPLDEVDVRTMASRRQPGLFLCGEILDVDGRIGGYNFQWAWASGRLAGMAAAGDGEMR